jgi:hypothetical protein
MRNGSPKKADGEKLESGKRDGKGLDTMKYLAETLEAGI